MQLLSASVFLSLLLACNASPVCPTAGQVDTPPEQDTSAPLDKYFGDSSANGSSIGAAYFITDDQSGNYVIGSDIGPDGLLTLRRAVSAKGVGAHGLHDLGPDGMFSAGSVGVNSEKGVLVTVNAGSNTAVAFKIDPEDPTDLKMIGEPVPSQGDFPASVALNKAADKVCVLNSGRKDGVSCYMLDDTKGLTPIPDTVRPVGLNQTTPPTGTSGTLSTIAFSEDETKLYVAVKGTDPAINVDVHPGFFAVWDIAENGALSKNFTNIPVPPGGQQPFSFTQIPGQNAILGADGAAGFYIWDLSTIDQGILGPRSSVTPVIGRAAVCWSAYSPNTGSYYVIDGVISNITEVTLDENLKPTSVVNFPQNIFDATIDVQIVPIGEQDHMYVLAANATAIHVLALEPGAMNKVQSLDFAGPSATLNLPIDPNSVQGMGIFMKQ